MTEQAFKNQAKRFEGMSAYGVERRITHERMRHQIVAMIFRRTELPRAQLHKVAGKIGYINLLGKSKADIEALI